MKAIIIRTFVIEEDELKNIINELAEEDDLEDHLADMDSRELEELCSNMLFWDTDVRIEE